MSRHELATPKKIEVAQEAEEFIAEAARSLSIIAEKNGLSDLQHLLDMVVLSADRELYEAARQYAEALKKLDDIRTS
ncbi:MAG: hypothetical protein R3D69_05900 [Xanthobacteraceae bacterium]